MFSTFDLCLLLYVIRLAGWLKHCNLSLSLVLRLLSVIQRPGETVCSVSMSLADVSGSEPSGPSSALSRSSVNLDDLSGDFSVLVSCPSRLQGLFLLLFLLLRAGCSIECSRSIASALHSMSFISLESRWSVFLLLNSDTISGLTTVLSCMLRGPTVWNLAPWMSSFARWYWFSSLVSWLSAFLCWLVMF